MVVNLLTIILKTFATKGKVHNFSCLPTPQQNGVVQHKNRVLKELA